MPNDAKAFQLNVERVNNIADGQQELTVRTSPITDEFGNLVSNGTRVELLISSGLDVASSTYAATIDGIATFTLLHPSSPEQWTYMARISDLAGTAEYSVSFEPFTSELPYVWNRESHELTVGPIIGSLNELAADGIAVTLKSPTGQLITMQVINGIVRFDLNKLGIKSLEGYKLISMGIIESIE